MMKKKILILGGSGLIGNKIIDAAKQKYEVHATFNNREVKNSNCSFSKLDITEDEQVNKLLSEIKPDVVVNTTGFHKVDRCEKEENEAMKINSNFISNLSDYAKKYSFKIIHFSTDYVFDGEQNIPYTENDQPNPINVYAKSKLDGEKFLKNSDHVVVRTSLVYGWSTTELVKNSSSGKSSNYAVWLLNKLHDNESVKIVSDQITCPTLVDSLADSILKILHANKSGTYNIAGISCQSRYEFSIQLAKKFGHDQKMILKIDSSEFKQKAKRPKFTCINSQKAINDFGLKLLTTDEALVIMRKQVLEECPELLGNN